MKSLQSLLDLAVEQESTRSLSLCPICRAPSDAARQNGGKVAQRKKAVPVCDALSRSPRRLLLSAGAAPLLMSHLKRQQQPWQPWQLADSTGKKPQGESEVGK